MLINLSADEETSITPINTEANANELPLQQAFHNDTLDLIVASMKNIDDYVFAEENHKKIFYYKQAHAEHPVTSSWTSIFNEIYQDSTSIFAGWVMREEGFPSSVPSSNSLH